MTPSGGSPDQGARPQSRQRAQRHEQQQQQQQQQQQGSGSGGAGPTAGRAGGADWGAESGAVAAAMEGLWERLQAAGYLDFRSRGLDRRPEAAARRLRVAELGPGALLSPRGPARQPPLLRTHFALPAAAQAGSPGGALGSAHAQFVDLVRTPAPTGAELTTNRYRANN